MDVIAIGKAVWELYEEHGAKVVTVFNALMDAVKVPERKESICGTCGEEGDAFLVPFKTKSGEVKLIVMCDCPEHGFRR